MVLGEFVLGVCDKRAEVRRDLGVSFGEAAGDFDCFGGIFAVDSGV